MKLDSAEVKALRAGLRARSPREVKRLFALVRAHNDRALLAALAPTKKRAAARSADPLLRDVQRMLKPVLGPAREKAEMLVEHLSKRRRRKLAQDPRGLADAIRQLRRTLSDEQIRTGTESLVAQLTRLYGDRETVA